MMDPLWSETWSTFKYFVILIVSKYCILCISWTIKCLITTLISATKKEEWNMCKSGERIQELLLQMQAQSSYLPERMKPPWKTLLMRTSIVVLLRQLLRQDWHACSLNNKCQALIEQTAVLIATILYRPLSKWRQHGEWRHYAHKPLHNTKC